jgi:hypothetical protein
VANCEGDGQRSRSNDLAIVGFLKWQPKQGAFGPANANVSKPRADRAALQGIAG